MHDGRCVVGRAGRRAAWAGRRLCRPERWTTRPAVRGWSDRARRRLRKPTAATPNRWRHDEHGHEDGHAVARAGRCRQPRPDPRARRSREQPQGRQHRDPEAPAHRLHRCLRFGQEFACVRHDRSGVAAADQRDIQRVRAGLHAHAGAARGRRARRADDRDPRRPGTDGRRRSLHCGHRDRCQRDVAHPLQSARAAAHRLAAGILVQRRLDQWRRGGHDGTWRPHDEGEAKLQHSRRHVPALRGARLRQRRRPDAAIRRQQVTPRGRAHDPRLQHGRLVWPDLHRLRLLRPG